MSSQFTSSQIISTSSISQPVRFPSSSRKLYGGRSAVVTARISRPPKSGNPSAAGASVGSAAGAVVAVGSAVGVRQLVATRANVSNASNTTVSFFVLISFSFSLMYTVYASVSYGDHT